jgi:hypothetical protein
MKETNYSSRIIVKIKGEDQALWLTSIIPATWEADIRKIVV